MTNPHNKEKALRFFEDFIENYIVEDLKILNSIQPNPVSGRGGCTIPTAMTIISTMDLLGFLLKPNSETKKSEDNITYFINFPNRLLPSYYDSATITKIYNYRHGMMHHFFPKFKGQFAGICKNAENKDLFIPQNINGTIEESLNVTVLTSDFLEALSKLKDFLLNSRDDILFASILYGLKNIDAYSQMNGTTTETTINPGTPQNKKQ